MTEPLLDQTIAGADVTLISREGSTWMPKNLDELSAVIGHLAQQDTPFAISARTGELANSTVVCSSEMTSATVDVDKGVATADAGVAMRTLSASVEKTGYAIAQVHQHHESITVGGLVARGDVAAASICGIEAILPTGEVTCAGGSVLKDVAGYDLTGALLGSMGRLAFIARVTFRLVPADAALFPVSARGEQSIAVGPALENAFDPHGLLRRE